MPRPAKKADCHPELKHYAKGLCRSCYSAQSSARQRRDNPEYERTRQRRWHQRNAGRRYIQKIKRDYGLEKTDYDALVEAQGNRCGICGCIAGLRRLHIDHCHSTDAVRGLLCHRCNKALGYFKDDIENLRMAIEYLLHPPMQQVGKRFKSKV